MKNKGMKFLAALTVIAFAFSAVIILDAAGENDATDAKTIYVDATQLDDSGDGLTADTAKKTFEAAQLMAATGDTILFVGNYDSTGGSMIDLAGKGLTLSSAGNPNVTITGQVRLATTQTLNGTMTFRNLNMNLSAMIGWEGDQTDRSELMNNVELVFDNCAIVSDVYDSTIRLHTVGKVDLSITNCSFENTSDSQDMRAIVLASKDDSFGSTVNIEQTSFTNYQRGIIVTSVVSLNMDTVTFTPHQTYKTGKPCVQVAGAVDDFEVSITDVTVVNNPENKPFFFFHETADGTSIKSFYVDGNVLTDDGNALTISVPDGSTFNVASGKTFNLGFGDTASVLEVAEGGKVVNNGTIIVNENATFSNEGTILNFGTITGTITGTQPLEAQTDDAIDHGTGIGTYSEEIEGVGTTTVDISTSAADVSIATANDTAVVSETVANAIIDAITESEADKKDISLDTTAQEVSLPTTLYTSEKTDTVTVSVNTGTANSAKISIPSDAIESTGAANISLAVKPAEAAAPAADVGDSSATAAFEIILTGANFVEGKTVSVAIDVDLPEGASNVRFYCIDGEGTKVVDAVYANGTATGDFPHFSVWTILYDLVSGNNNGTDIVSLINQINSQNQPKATDNSKDVIVVAVAAIAAAVVCFAALMVTKRN